MNKKKNEAAMQGGEAGEVARKEPNFERAMARLEAIVADMESGTMSLEAMMERFEEGQELVKFCSLKLNEVERRIEILVKKGEQFVAEPFPEQEAVDDGMTK